MPAPDEKYLPTDKTFKVIVIGSSGLALATVTGSAAALEHSPGQGLHFAWHWSVLVWSAAAALCAWPFWRLVWAVQECPTRKTKARLLAFCFFLLLLGLGLFLYPMRFTSAAFRSEALVGLALAAVFLGIGAALLCALARAFSSEEPAPPTKRD